MTDGDDEIHKLLMQIADDPTAYRTVVAHGADLRGIPMTQVYEWDAHGREALEIAQDDSAEPRRRELCRQIGIAYANNVYELAVEGLIAAAAQWNERAACVN